MNKTIIYEYYYLALKDLEDGASIEDLEEALYLYESAEMYEECAGIFKAIKEVKYDRKIKNNDS